MSKRLVVLLTLLGATLWIAAIAKAVVVATALSESMAMQGWIEVPARIVRLEKSRHEVNRGDRPNRPNRHTVEWSMQVEYEYAFEGHTYRGTRQAPEHRPYYTDSFRPALYDALDRARHDARAFPCYVDPAAPHESVLIRDMSALGVFGDALVMSLFLLAPGGLLLRWGLRKLRVRQSATKVA